MERMIEVCAGSYQDCIAAYHGNAKRVELNSALSVGGLTPSVASLVRVKKETDLTVICMVRPRAAGFCYEKEVEKLEECGVMIYGENKVQDFLKKYEDYHGKGVWHFIGTLQTNKVKYIIDKVQMIHSVANYRLIDEIEKQAAKHNLVMDILLQVKR
mgnify:CR=1 FL=1